MGDFHFRRNHETKSVNKESELHSGGSCSLPVPEWIQQIHSWGSVFGNEGSAAALKCHFQELVIGVNAEQNMIWWGLLPVRNRLILSDHSLLKTVTRILTHRQDLLFLFSCNLIDLMASSFFLWKMSLPKNQGKRFNIGQKQCRENQIWIYGNSLWYNFVWKMSHFKRWWGRRGSVGEGGRSMPSKKWGSELTMSQVFTQTLRG